MAPTIYYILSTHIQYNTYLAEALLRELFLLELEHEGVELLLQPLVGVVDQKLLQRVGTKRLEPENVQ